MSRLVCFCALLFSAMLGFRPALAADGEQLIYLPIYSHVYFGDLDKAGQPGQKLLSAHVSIRNTDPTNPLRVLYARYYDTEGRLVKNYLPAAKTIPPMGTLELFVPRGDTTGGSGANFLIGWKAEGTTSAPLAEAVHAAIELSRTLTFVTSGRPVAPVK